jgi:hypothetical protein
MPKKVDNYSEKRKEILFKVLEILGIEISSTKKSFILEDINEEQKEKICDMELEIRKYYKVSNWYCFRKSTEEEIKWLSIIRQLVKENSGVIMSKYKKHNLDNITEYYVLI